MRIVESLIERIEEGHISPGDQLAPERALAAEFGVNRRTLRQALDVLQRRGLVERRQGAGTFLAQPKVERPAAEFFHFTERARRHDLNPGSLVLSLERIAASRFIASKLGVAAGADVYKCRRLRTLGAEPIMLETFSLPAGLFPGFDRLDIESRSVYEILANEYGVEVEWARQSLEAVALSDAEARWLGVAPGDPGMLEHRLAHDRVGRIVEFGSDLYRGDRVRFITDAATVAVEGARID